jgi:hypothetical protein
MSENSGVYRVTIAYTVGIAVFWLLYFLNTRRHWISARPFLVICLALGLALCIGTLLVAAFRDRSTSAGSR